MRLPVADLMPEIITSLHLYPIDYQRWAAGPPRLIRGSKPDPVLPSSANAGHHQVQFPGAYSRSPPDFNDEAGGAWSDEPFMSRLKFEVSANPEFRDPFDFDRFMVPMVARQRKRTLHEPAPAISC
jgi:hypothetical protein